MHEARRHKIPGKLLRSPAPGSHFVYLSAQEKRNFMGKLLRGGRGGGDSHMKWTGMLVVSLKGVNFGFWSRLGCSGQNVIYFEPVRSRLYLGLHAKK